MALFKSITELEKHRCHQCNRPFAIRELSGATGWIINLASCRCDNAKETLLARISEQTSTTSNADAENKNVQGVPDTIDDRFEVLQLLGSGGMGTVYKVRDTHIDRVFALKTLHADLVADNVAKKRFEQEAEAAAKLDHPNLVSIYAHGNTKAGEAFLLMEYVEGESLAQVLAREGVLDEERAIKIFTQICEGLIHSHENKIVHRDIKPANIILSKLDNGEEVARIVDFGVAKTLPTAGRETRDLTQTGEVFGSPHYMSPEQCLGFMLDQRSDIYSLGCLMYETLSGKPPFGGNNPIQLVVKHINERAKPFLNATEKSPRLKGLQSITLHCLEKEPSDRFQEVSEISELLYTVAAGKQIHFVADSKLKEAVLTAQLQPLAHLTALAFLSLYLMILTPTQHTTINVPPFLVLIPAILLVLLGAIVLVCFAIASFSISRETMASKRHWWCTLSILFSALFFVGLIAPLICLGLGTFDLKFFPTQMHTVLRYTDVFVFLGVLVSVLSSLGCILCSLASLLDLGRRHEKFKVIAAKAVILLAVAVCGTFFGFPKQTAHVTGFMSQGIMSLPSFLKSGLEIRLADLSVRLDPNNPDNIESHAKVYTSNKLYSAALDDYDKLISMPEKEGGKSVHLYANYRGSLLKEQGQIEKAIEEFTREIKLCPDSPYGFSDRANCYMTLGRFALADADYKRAIQLVPNQSEYYYLRVKALLRMGKTRDAIDVINRRMKLSSGQVPAAYVVRGFLYELSGEPDLAKQDYIRATEKSKADNSDQYYYSYIARTMAYVKLGETAKAKEEYATAKTKHFDLRECKTYFLNWFPDELRDSLRETIPELK